MVIIQPIQGAEAPRDAGRGSGVYSRNTNTESEKAPGCWNCFRRLFKRRRPVVGVVVELKLFEKDQFVELAEECKEEEEVAEPIDEKREEEEQPFVTDGEECEEQKQVVETTKAEEEGKEESKQVTLKERNLQVCPEEDGDDWTFVNRKTKKESQSCDDL